MTVPGHAPRLVSAGAVGVYGYLRNRIGALLLVDGPDNGSYGGMLLEDKLT